MSARWSFLVLLLGVPLGCDTEAVAGSREAISGGAYDAVMCMPQIRGAMSAMPGTNCQLSGWDTGCVWLCAQSVTLVSPRFAVASRDRFLSQTLPLLLGARTYTEGAPADVLLPTQTAFEVGVAVNAIDDGPRVLRHATGCYELRRSGIAPCCRHVYRHERTLLPPDRYIRVYQPPEALWDVPYYEPGGSTRHPVEVVQNWGWGRSATYRRYLEECPAPMAADDDVVSPFVIFALDRRMEETEAAPIPLALEYPDGTVDPAWFAASGALGDVAGFGDNDGESTSIGYPDGIRFAVTAATALAELPSLLDPSDPTSYDPRQYRFTADGGAFTVRTALEGDGFRNGGAAHTDFSAPWIHGALAARRLYAIHNGGESLDQDVSYVTHLTPETAPHVRAFFDPDGDGRLRGSVSPGGATYVDADADGLAEYREVVRGAAGSEGCVDAVPPIPGQCLLATLDDNCAPPPGHASPEDFANPTQRDVDGDLAGDACDLCPEIWDPDQATCAVIGDHPAVDPEVFDGDRIGVACSPDTDGDGVPNWCDNCPSIASPLQEDASSDDRGDACEVDSDYDGVVDDLDGCPFTWDPAQEVCNADVPQPHPHNGRPMGVACAPTPCAMIDPIVTSSTDARGFESELRNDLVEGTGFVTQMAPVSETLPSGCLVRRHDQTRAGTGLVTTGMRWCPCDGLRVDSVAARERCEDTFGCTREAGAYPIPAISSDRRWRSMTLDFERPPPILSPRGDEAVLPYGPAPLRYATGRPRADCLPEELLVPAPAVTPAIGLRGRWDFAGDAAREHAALIAELTACDPTCPGTCNALGVCDPSGARPAPYLTDRVNPFSSESLVRAVGWAHSVRYERCDVRPCAGAGGTRPGGGALGSRGAGSDQASHYWSGETVARTFTSGREPDFAPWFPFLIPFPDICWFCADAFPDLWLSHRACGASGCAADWVARAEGADVPVNDLLTMGAHIALTQLELAWVLPRELKEHLGEGAVLGVGLDAQAQVIAQLAVTDAGTLGLVEEKGDPLPPPPNPNEIQAADVAFPQRASDGCRMDAPRARAGAVFLLGNLRALAAVGGEGAGSDHVTFTHLDTGRIHSIPLVGVRPGPVLAAAMHVTRMEALVLDEHVEPPRGRGARGRGAVFARFLVVDLRSGESRELLRFPRAAAFDRYQLVGLADGRYGLVATHERSERTWVFALAPSPGGLALTGWRRLRGVPLGPPVSSVRGLSIPFLARGARTWTPVGVRAPDFAPCRQDDLRSVL